MFACNFCSPSRETKPQLEHTRCSFLLHFSLVITGGPHQEAMVELVASRLIHVPGNSVRSRHLGDKRHVQTNSLGRGMGAQLCWLLYICGHRVTMSQREGFSGGNSVDKEGSEGRATGKGVVFIATIHSHWVRMNSTLLYSVSFGKDFADNTARIESSMEHGYALRSVLMQSHLAGALASQGHLPLGPYGV